jgi:hypothetical protein
MRSTAFVRVGDEGTKSLFRFCPECEATVYYTFAGYEDSIAIPVGASPTLSFGTHLLGLRGAHALLGADAYRH